MLWDEKTVRGLLHEDLLQTGDASIPGTEIPDSALEAESEMTIVVDRHGLLHHQGEGDPRTEIEIARTIAHPHLVAGVGVTVAAAATAAAAAILADEADILVRKAER